MTGAPRLRLATEDDASAVAAIYGPVVRDTAISFELSPPTAEEMGSRIRATLAQWPWLVAVDHHPSEIAGDAPALLGYAYAGAFRARPAYRWTTEATVYIHPSAQGRSVGTGLYVALLGLLRVAGYRSVVGGITLPNPASVALHERLGFRHVGTFVAAGWKFGGWHDVGFWRVELCGDEAPGGPPLPVDSLLQSPEWEACLRAGEARMVRHRPRAGL